MQFTEEGFSTQDSLSSTYQGVGASSMLFDIMQTKLSDNVLPVTTQHVAVGQHCIDMLLRKDRIQLDSVRSRAGGSKSKSPAGTKGQEAAASHLATDNVLQHLCKLKYPSMGGTPRSGGGIQKPMAFTRKQSIGSKSRLMDRN